MANWSPFFRGGRPRVGGGREFTQGPGTSRVQGPACSHRADHRSNRHPEERPRWRMPQMPINWEGLAPRRVCRQPRRQGIPAGGCTLPARLSTPIEHLLFAWPGIPGTYGGETKMSKELTDQQGTRANRNPRHTHRRLLLLRKPSSQLFCKINNQPLISHIKKISIFTD